MSRIGENLYRPLAIQVRDFSSWVWHRQPTAVIEQAECSREITAEIGSTALYTRPASLTKVNRFTETMA